MALNPDFETVLSRRIDDFAVQKGCLEQVRDVLTQPTAVSTRKGIVGGNVKFTFLNHHMAHVKSLKGPLTDEQVISERAKALLEWHINYLPHPDRYLEWYFKFRHELENRCQNVSYAYIKMYAIMNQLED